MTITAQSVYTTILALRPGSFSADKSFPQELLITLYREIPEYWLRELPRADLEKVSVILASLNTTLTDAEAMPLLEKSAPLLERALASRAHHADKPILERCIEFERTRIHLRREAQTYASGWYAIILFGWLALCAAAIVLHPNRDDTLATWLGTITGAAAIATLFFRYLDFQTNKRNLDQHNRWMESMAKSLDLSLPSAPAPGGGS